MIADDLVLSIRQISQYPLADVTSALDTLLVQRGGLGGPYMSLQPDVLVGTALELGGYIKLAPLTGGIAFNGARFSFDGRFILSEHLVVPSIETGAVTVDGQPVALLDELQLLAAIPKVDSFNGRTGRVVLETNDILSAGGIAQNNPHFTGLVLAPTVWDTRTANDQVATTAFVQNVIGALLCSGSVVTAFNGRGGDVTLTVDDVTAALTATPGTYARANSPPLGDTSTRIATTMFVDESMADLENSLLQDLSDAVAINLADYAKLDSPQFVGIPTAPTANPGSSTGQIATTAFVQAAVTAGTAGVSSFNTRTGAVTLTSADVTSAGGALLAGPTFTGIPKAPTATTGTNTTQLATCAFVLAELATVAAGVASFNTRTGAVTLTLADVTSAGGAPLSSPALTGTPTTPTATAGTNTTQIASTAFVTAAVAAASGVASFNGRTGVVTLQANDVSAVGGALVASPTFTGVPAAPTASPGTNTTQIATTAYVQAALTAGSVTSFNARTGAITLVSADISGAGGALLASPAFSGTPTAPTATAGTNNTTLATTAFVMNALGGSIVSTFNGRSGAVTLTTADITGAGGAPLASPTFTGSPAAPTPTAGNNSTLLATTAFVANAIGAAVVSFNGRTGAVTFQASDVSAVGGALLASPTFTGTPSAPTAANNTLTNQLATCQYVSNMLGTLGGVTSFNGRAGVVTLTLADVTGVGGAPLASPALTGTPTAPTATAGTNTTQVASTAFVTSAVAAVSGGPLAIQVFTASGTYTPTTGMTKAIIECVGGGGGGGAAFSNASSQWACSGGGGSGGYSKKLVTAADVGASKAVTIGAGGAGGIISPVSDGTAGGDTSVGTLCVAKGGAGGGQANVGNMSGGLGGSGAAGTGDIKASGAPGGGGMISAADGNHYGPLGHGGSSFFGGGAALGSTATAGNGVVGVAATNYGSGGSGATVFGGTANTHAGGAGSSGIVVITEYK